jgi:hypothetical protein
MKLKSLAVASALAVASFGAQAAAISYVADDFSAVQPTVTGDGSTVSGSSTYMTSRTVTVTGTTIDSVVRTLSSPNRLSIGHDDAGDSTVNVTWAWSSALTSLFANASNVKLMLAVFSNNGEPSTTNNSSNPAPVGGVIAAGTSTLTYNLGTLGSSFSLDFNGQPAWDLSLRSLTVEGDCNAGYAAGTGNAANTCVRQVPVPGSVALLGLGLIGLAGLRRRA